ncbi:ABC transporter ATP-binding protein [Candidatus Woesearchaeota archaeon]|jgi:ATP-binding cassette subfamily B protein|nr:ABC transporter ATP-binding protein [Candidatus Woesearchaeota archaeon]MBT3438375.1 ABC transporter ATP-binding protein [Candidatus Woesearchaeota archaeon]MBT4058370.1 ABC transporter ATP-binding protein [Candidatus Woesearchaeota archaeon]MBT4207616.1 ABC transporter ATP-binding protein [Candidatus Woesearchaeota archaeon]MBT4730621.1 ABC transporter ATP-binding protein [Candidatus Woesearchaeota archaeon]
MKRYKREEIDFKYNLGIYWSILKKHKPVMFILLLLVLFVEASHTLTKFLFKVLVDKGELLVKSEITKDYFVGILLILLSVYLLLVFLRSISNWWDHYLLAKLDGELIYDIKEKYFNHLVNLSHNFHTSNKTGSIIARLTRGGRAIESMTDIIVFNFSPLIFQTLVVGGSLFYIGWIPAVSAMSTIVLFIGFSLYLQSKTKDKKMNANNQDDFEKGIIADIFTNIDSIKYFGKEKAIMKKFAKISKDTKTRLILHWNSYNWLSAGQSFILGLGSLITVFFPMVEFANGNLSLGQIVFVWTIYGNLIGPMFSFVHGIKGYYKIMGDFESLFRYGKEENEIKEPSNAKKLKIKKGTINFEDLSFKYHKRRIFSNFNLEIKKNEKVAFVGHSGCGKSTLIKLLYRLHNLERGRILIDNKDIREFKQDSLRSELSIVPQECVLFDDTIYNNIKFSNPKATNQEVWKAIRFAQLHKVIQSFPEKEKTVVGERGVKLSGGEKQRVSIARAVLANKKILVLDEATSALDSETEHEIQKDLEKLMKGRTSIIIAHRLSTIMHSDKIVVMKKGKIVQMGTHRQLIKKPGEYKKLWNLQKGGYIK